MICGFIQDQEIRSCGQKFAQHQTGLLSAGKTVDPGTGVLPAKKIRSQSLPDLFIRQYRKQLVIMLCHCLRGRYFRAVLIKIPCNRPFPQNAGTGQRGKKPCRGPEESRLSCPVFPDDPYFLPVPDPQRQTEKRLLITDLQLLRLHHPFVSRNLRLNIPRKDMDLILQRLFHPLHPLQDGLPGADKGGFSGLMPEPLDQCFKPLHLLLLLLIGLPDPCRLLLPLFAIPCIVSRISFQLPPAELIDHRSNLIQKKTVMGHENHCLRVGLHILLQPDDGFYVQMVGRLIQKQNIRLLQQQPDQDDLCLFSAGKRGNLLRFVLLPEAEARKDPVILGFKKIPFPGEGLQFHFRKSHFQEFCHSSFLILFSGLAQESHDSPAGCPYAGTLPFIIPVQGELPGDQSEKGGFTRAVLSYDPDLLIAAYLKINMGQDFPAPGRYRPIPNFVQHFSSFRSIRNACRHSIFHPPSGRWSHNPQLP